MIKTIVAYTKRGAYATIAILVSPLGAFRMWENNKTIVAYTKRGAYATIAIIVSP